MSALHVRTLVKCETCDRGVIPGTAQCGFCLLSALAGSAATGREVITAEASGSKTILFVGPSGCGKDFACTYLAGRTGLKFWGSTSQVIALEISRQTGSPLEVVYGSRHKDRDQWRALGDQLRADDPAHLLKVCLSHGAKLLNGTRALPELEAARKCIDHIIWIDRPGIPADPTLEFGPYDVDFHIGNYGDRANFCRALDTLAKALNLKAA